MRLLSTLILGGAVVFASPALFAAGHGHGGNGHHHGGHGGGGHHHHGGHNHGGGNYPGGHHHHHHHHQYNSYWPGYNTYRPNYGYGIAPFPYYGAYGIGSPYYRAGNGFSLYIGR